MKSLINVIGILLVIFGVVSLGYHGYEYNTREKVAQLGNIEVTQETTKVVYFSPLAGGISLAVGLVLLIFVRRK
jgi:hypothetical protein